MPGEIRLDVFSDGSKKRCYINRKMCREFDTLMRTFGGDLIIYDIESTGLSTVSDRIVQLSAVKLRRMGQDRQYRIIEAREWWINPERPMPPGATAVNHITDEMLSGKKTETELFPEIEAFFEGVNTGDIYLCGYNITKFDNAIMNSMFLRHGKRFLPLKIIDVYTMAKELIDPSKLPIDIKNGGRSYKQVDVSDLLGLQLENMHNASTDVIVSGRVLFTLYNMYLRDFRVPENYYRGKPVIKITGMARMKKSKIVDYVQIFVAAVINGTLRKGTINYDRYYRRFLETDGDIMQYADMPKFAEDADLWTGGDIRKFKFRK